MYDDYDDYDSLMDETDDILFNEEEDEVAYNAYRVYREEQAAYDDFIASLDMADD